MKRIISAMLFALCVLCCAFFVACGESGDVNGHKHDLVTVEGRGITRNLYRKRL